MDTYEELGTQERPSPEEKARIYSKLGPGKKINPVATNEERKKQNVDAIATVLDGGFFWDPLEPEGVSSSIIGKIGGAPVEFWPATDTYHFKNEYGTGIQDFCEKMKKNEKS